ncbi:MAG: redoxin domain-containing protein [Spirochaetes bacterium]|nr:redoxin domain-containing protein [Spirochaetota bacterium]
MRNIQHISLVLLLLVLSSCSSTDAKNEPPMIGHIVPDFSLSDQDGTIWKLSDVVKRHRGVVLAYYPKDDTKL